MFQEILTAFCLVMVFEGILPFLSPERYKRTLLSVLNVPNEHLRIIGLSSMIGGVILLTLLR